MRGLVDIGDAHDAPSTRQPADKEREGVQGRSAATVSAAAYNSKDAVHGSSTLRYKGNGCNGDFHDVSVLDRGQSAVFPPPSVLKKSHKKGVSKSVVGAGTVMVTGSAAEVRFNSHALGIKVGAGAGVVSREVHAVSKGAGGSAGPPYVPSSSSSVLHPQPSIASQRQRRTDGAAGGDFYYPILFGCTSLL